MAENARRDRLQEFVGFASGLRGDEKGEAQIFLDRLFKAFGQPGAIEAGAEYETRMSRPGRRGVSFADLVWEDTLLVEMNARGRRPARGGVQECPVSQDRHA